MEGKQLWVTRRVIGRGRRNWNHGTYLEGYCRTLWADATNDLYMIRSLWSLFSSSCLFLGPWFSNWLPVTCVLLVSLCLIQSSLADVCSPPQLLLDPCLIFFPSPCSLLDLHLNGSSNVPCENQIPKWIAVLTGTFQSSQVNYGELQKL